MATPERRRKRDLKELNNRAWDGEKDVFETSASLDSNLKKNTAFIKRLRTAITAANQATFLQEIRTLSLHKYLTEIISACFEGLTKVKIAGDVTAAVEIVSALHQRFGPAEFTCFLAWYLGRGLATPDKAQLKTLTAELREREEKERLSRQRVLLRVATDLWLVGVLRSLEDVNKPEEAGKVRDNLKGADTGVKIRQSGVKSDGTDPEPFPLEVLKDMLGQDREHVNLPLVVLFVKTFAWDVLGAKATKTDAQRTINEDRVQVTGNGHPESASSADNDGDDSSDPSLTSTILQQRFKNILLRYFEDVKTHIIRAQQQLSAQGRKNAEAYVKSGEVFEDRQNNYEKALKAQDKLVSSAQIIADVLGAEMPDLQEKDSIATGNESSIGLVKTGDYLRGQTDGAGIWEDEDERRFYENLVDLKDRVPGILLEDGKKKRIDQDEQVGKRNDEVEDGKAQNESKTNEADELSTAIANKNVGAQVDALLARLPELATKDSIDQFAMDFCFMNSKASRNRLVKALEEIPKGRTDLLPVYARLIATLGRYLTDVPSSLVTYLDDEFRSLQRRKSKEFLGQVRMMNIRYIAELTKFGVVPEHVIFHCLKVSLDDFSRMNLEIIANLLENCGRYLLRNPETSPRMISFLETLQRKKAAQHLGQQERMLVENAVYYVNPPDRAAIQQKERTTFDLFVRKLIYTDLGKKNVDKTNKQIRKLHWEEEEVVEIMRKIFVKPAKIRYHNIYLLATLLAGVHRFHADFVVTVLDELLERVVVGLEINDFKYNQRRIAEVKYLGELYMYRIVDGTLIFDVLYKLLNYGHEGGYAQPGKICAIDLPDDYFRIRLACALLETCGQCFEKGANRKKLDFYLSFLQFYWNIKDPLPMDIEFQLQDTFSAIRPNWKLVIDDLNEASKTFSDAVKQNFQDMASDKPVEAEEAEDVDIDLDVSDDGRGDEEENGHTEALSGDVKSDSDDDDQDRGEVNEGEDSDEEHIVVTRPEDLRDPDADAEFDRELAKMMAESAESRKFERKTLFDVPLPMRRTLRDVTAVSSEDNPTDLVSETSASKPGIMKFALLSKKGNRQQTRSIDLPADSQFAIAMRNQQEAEKAEQQRIKNLVLNYDLTDDQPDGSLEALHNQPRYDKAGNSRSKQRARKLQLGDIDW